MIEEINKVLENILDNQWEGLRVGDSIDKIYSKYGHSIGSPLKIGRKSRIYSLSIENLIFFIKENILISIQVNYEKEESFNFSKESWIQFSISNNFELIENEELIRILKKDISLNLDKNWILRIITFM